MANFDTHFSVTIYDDGGWNVIPSRDYARDWQYECPSLSKKDLNRSFSLLATTIRAACEKVPLDYDVN